MAILLELKPEIEARLQAEAHAKGLPVAELAGKLIEEHTISVQVVAAHKRTPEEMMRRLMEIAKQMHALPTLDTRTADEIIGYDEYGMP
jgi:antitoxin VapB